MISLDSAKGKTHFNYIARMVLFAAILGLIVFRLVLTVYQKPSFSFSLHDQYLYVIRSYHFIQNLTLGEYKQYTLLKNIDLSILLAFFSLIGVSFTFFKIFSLVSYIRFSYSLANSTFKSVTLSLVFVLVVIFSPILLTQSANEPLREIFQIFFLVIFLMSFLSYLSNGTRTYLYISAFISIFLFGLREENELLVPFVIVVGFMTYFWGKNFPDLFKRFMCLALVLFLTVTSIYCIKRIYIYKTYHINLQNDFAGGEFPNFVNALRMVQGSNDKYVSITEDKLQLVANVVPEFKKVYDAWPKPNQNSSDYQALINGKSEWRDSHNLIWIKDAVYNSATDKSAIGIQKFYRDIALKIHHACDKKIIMCNSMGSKGLLLTGPILDFKEVLKNFFNIWKRILSPKVTPFFNSVPFLLSHPHLTLEEMALVNERFSIVLLEQAPHDIFYVDRHLNDFISKNPTFFERLIEMRYLVQNPDVAESFFNSHSFDTLNTLNTNGEKKYSNSSLLDNYLNPDFDKWTLFNQSILNKLSLSFEECFYRNLCFAFTGYTDAKFGLNHFNKFGGLENRLNPYPNSNIKNRSLPIGVQKTMDIWSKIYSLVLSPLAIILFITLLFLSLKKNGITKLNFNALVITAYCLIFSSGFTLVSLTFFKTDPRFLLSLNFILFNFSLFYCIDFIRGNKARIPFNLE
jgi:hypothetical protein